MQNVVHKQNEPMTLSDEHIFEIAELLECGMICYYHRLTGVIESHPDPDDPYSDPEAWQDTIDKVENDWDSYETFKKMNSAEGFEVMEKFAYSLDDHRFRDKILDRLSKRKPFQNFKVLIDSSDYRQDWFKFKKNAYIDFVKEQVVLKK